MLSIFSAFLTKDEIARAEKWEASTDSQGDVDARLKPFATCAHFAVKYGAGPELLLAQPIKHAFSSLLCH